MRFFDFFAGIGGFRLGMEMAGHECVGHCEIDKFADKSYRAMHNPKESEVIFDDVRTVNPTDMTECECYCYGFPCQAFSIAGKRRGFEDTRGTLFFEVMRLAKERHPNLLFAENVPGLLNHEGGRTFETIIETMAELGYMVEWQILNSKDFGVPQNRRRVFIIGHFGGKPGRAVFPITEGRGSVGKLQGQQNRKTDFIIPAVREPNLQAGRVYDDSGMSPSFGTFQGGQSVPKIAVKNATKSGVVLANIGGVVNIAFPESNTRRGRVIDDGNISPTLDTGCKVGVITLDDGSTVRIRKLTPRECFRLQGFPDEYFDRARAVNSDSQLYKQAGNSVTVNVVYEIAKRLGGIYEKNN